MDKFRIYIRRKKEAQRKKGEDEEKSGEEKDREGCQYSRGRRAAVTLSRSRWVYMVVRSARLLRSAAGPHRARPPRSTRSSTRSSTSVIHVVSLPVRSRTGTAGSSVDETPSLKVIPSSGINVDRLWNGCLLRTVGAVDTVIAAYAIRNDATVFHYDRDFERVASAAPGFRLAWAVPRGTIV